MSVQQSPRCARQLCWCGICHCDVCEFHRAAILLGRLLGVPFNLAPMPVRDFELRFGKKTGLLPLHR